MKRLAGAAATATDLASVPIVLSITLSRQPPPPQPLRRATRGCVVGHMTQTLGRATGITPHDRVTAWLADFEAALAARDIDRAVAKFATDSFWRDLVAFTWNIKTVEGRDQIAGMLGERLAGTGPSGFRTREDA